MALLKKNIKGLQDIRTLGGRVDQAAVPYKAYIRLSSLEMEKFRYGEERMRAIHRVENIDARFKEVEEVIEKVCGRQTKNKMSPEPAGRGKKLSTISIKGRR